MPMGMSRLGARGRREWVASILAAVEIACNFGEMGAHPMRSIRLVCPRAHFMKL